MLIAPDLEATEEKISTSLVLTCAHFFRTAPIGAFYVRGRGLNRKLQAVRTIDGTDIAIALLQRPAPARELLGVGTQSLSPGMKTATLGYGGNSKYAIEKRGTVLLPIPISYSRGFETRVRPAAIQINTPKAIKGDSGGAVLSMRDGDTQPTINAVQSLVLDPLGINLGLATVAQTSTHKKSLCRAAQGLIAMQY
ncbi:serine protease [Corynebacteriaceae bacterium 6-324]